MPAREARQLSPLTLAYMGDTVYDLYVRRLIISQGDRPANALHKAAIAYVKAAAQSAAYERVLPLLTEDEAAVARRGRNAHAGTVPKNADPADYARATAFEAVIGYLYLTGESERIASLMDNALGTPRTLEESTCPK